MIADNQLGRTRSTPGIPELRLSRRPSRLLRVMGICRCGAHEETISFRKATKSRNCVAGRSFAVNSAYGGMRRGTQAVPVPILLNLCRLARAGESGRTG
jgi:hypothetical protein